MYDACNAFILNSCYVHHLIQLKFISLGKSVETLGSRAACSVQSRILY